MKRFQAGPVIALCLCLQMAAMSPAIAQSGAAPDSAAAAAASASASQSASQGASQTPPTATANDTADDKASIASLIGSQNMTAIGKELATLFVAAVLLEGALATLFQWRAYRMLLNARAWKTPIMLFVSLLLVYVVDYDPFARLLATTRIVDKVPAHAGFFTGIVSALILAGGSSGVNSLFRALGIRAPNEDAPTAPSGGKGWVSVTVRPKSRTATARYNVIIETVGPPPAPAAIAGPNPPAGPLAAVVSRQTPAARLRALFWPDPLRFPNNGGTEVTPGTVYRIWVDVAGDNPPPAVLVYEGTFIVGAIVDLVADV